MYWLQPGGQFVGDQAFDAFAYSASLNEYITSWRVKSPNSVTLWLAILLSILGFIVQFVGLRNVHSSIAMYLLVSTLIMAIIRASLRSNRLQEGSNQLLASRGMEGHELDWLAWELGQPIPSSPNPDTSQSHTNVWDLPEDNSLNARAELATTDNAIHDAGKPSLISDSKELKCTLKDANEKWKIVQDHHGDIFKIYHDDHYYMAFALSFFRHPDTSTNKIQLRGVNMVKHREKGKIDPSRPNLGASIMHFRARLADITGNSSQITTKWDLNIRDVAINLQTAIEKMTDHMLSYSTRISPDNCEVFSWSTSCWAGRTGERLGQYPIHFLLHTEQGRWRTSAEKLEAVLGLWLSSLSSTRHFEWTNRGPGPKFRSLFRTYSDRHFNNATSTLQMWAPTQVISRRYDSSQYTSGREYNTINKGVWFLFPGDSSEPFPQTCFPGEYATSLTSWGCLALPYQTRSAAFKLAQSIFTMFMTAISRFVLPLSPKEAVEELLFKQSPPRKIERLLEIFISAGLGQREDAIATIIPPLLATSWLPSANVMICWAIDHNRLDAVTFLLESGAVNVEWKDENGLTIFEHAKIVDQAEISKKLEEYMEVYRKALEEEERRKEEDEYYEQLSDWVGAPGW
jgi:hypothetical protein